MAEPLRDMVISHDSNETRVALVEDLEVVELYIERPRRSVVGNVYLGKVKDVLPGMQAAFVDIGLEKNAFLFVDEVVAPEGVEGVPKRDIQSLLKQGQTIMVQVVKDAMGTKGARVTTEVTLPGRFVVLMPFSSFVGVSRKIPDEERDRLQGVVAGHVPAGVGVIVRTVAQGVSEADLVSDIEFLTRLWKRVQHQLEEALAPEIIYTEMDLALRMVRDVFSDDYRRLVIDDKGIHDKVVAFLKKTSPHLVRRVSLQREPTSLFDEFGLQAVIESVVSRNVYLKSGGHITIDSTEALTAIDVNTGRYVGRRNLEDTVLRANLEACDEVVRQCRLRDIGGIIVVDFIDMEELGHRNAVLERLADRLSRDRTRTRLSPVMSKLGLVEFTRKNTTDGLYGTLTEVCPCCAGEGRLLSRQTRRILVERAMRDILIAGRSQAYLFGLNPETYELVMAPGNNTVAILRAETDKQVSIVPEPACASTEVRVLMEGRSAGLAGQMDAGRPSGVDPVGSGW